MITVRHVPETHPASMWTAEVETKLPSDMVAWFEDNGDTHSRHAICVYDGGEIVGLMRYGMVSSSMLYAGGTYVVPKYRKSMLGLRMWALALQRRRPKKVRVVTVSRGGKRLVQTLIQDHPQIQFEHFLLQS